MAVQEDNRNDYYNVQCPVCGKKFHLKPYHLNKYKTHYCSKECFNESKKNTMKGELNHQYGLKGEKNASWKGGTKISNYGYRLVASYGHPFSWNRSDYVFEHRLIAERYLLTEENSVLINGKRYLSPEYVVHHKNHIRTDNRVENLEVMTEVEHSRLHAAELNKRMERDASGRFAHKAESHEDKDREVRAWRMETNRRT